MNKLRVIIFIVLGCLLLTNCTLGQADRSSEKLATLACNDDGIVERDQVPNPANSSSIPFEYYLPPCYEQQAEAAYPVVYLLPGAGGSAGVWNRNRAAEIANQMILAETVPPFILITPSTTTINDSCALPILELLVPYVDETFRTLTGRRHRVIGGASEGAFLSACLTFQFSDQFGSVGIFGGGILNTQVADYQQWIANMPPEQWPRVYIDIGDGDQGAVPFATLLTDILDQHEIPYQFNMGAGGHDFVYWGGHLEMYYRWYAEEW